MLQGTRALSICAVIAVRNEAPYLRVLLPLLARQQIDCAVIDHESSDDTAEILRECRDRPVIATVTLPYAGHFSLRQQLEAKRTVIAGLPHHWVVHQDADEILQHRRQGGDLRDAIQEANAAGFNVVNFDEFCFLPEPHEDYAGTDFVTRMQRYYHFAPCPSRLNRAWLREAQLNNIAGMGHTLTGEGLRIWPENHVLRHYIVLSQAHAWRKYVGRQFAQDELADGFHGNRKALTQDQLLLPDAARFLFSLADTDGRPLTTACPTGLHYWQWPAQSCHDLVHHPGHR